MREGSPVFYGFTDSRIFDTYFERSTSEEVVAVLDAAATEVAIPVVSKPSPWRIMRWSDEQGRTVRRMGFHLIDLDKVLALPFPENAAVRNPMTWYTGVEKIEGWYLSKSPMEVGTDFSEEINQGLRDCTVVAVDPSTGRYMYEYTMPKGTSAPRRENGRPVSYKSLSTFWRRLIDSQFGLKNLVAKPQ